MSCSDEKKSKIKESILVTKEKRKSQCVKVRSVKLTSNKINKTQVDKLTLCFLEAKWFYNDIIRSNNIFNYDIKNKIVTVLDKNKNPSLRTLSILSSQMKQSIYKQILSNKKGIVTNINKGLYAGKLGFKKVCNTINLNQFGITYKMLSNSRIRIQGLGSFHIRGLQQFEKGCDFANAKLVRKPSGFYIHITSYINKTSNHNSPKGVVGLDFGIKKTITTSDNKTFSIYFPETEHLKSLQRKLNNHQKGSKNYIKTLLEIRKEYECLTNKKDDAANKILSYLKSHYAVIMIQDENLSGWAKDSRFGKIIQSSCLGRVKAKVRLEDHILIDRYFPSTKKCYVCGMENDIGLSRIYTCSCGHSEERDLKAAKTILIKGLLEMGKDKAVSLQEDVKTLLEGCWIRKELNSFLSP